MPRYAERLGHWLRHSWISRVSLCDRLRAWTRRWLERRTQPFPRQFVPLLEVLEKRIVFTATQFTLGNYQEKESAPYAVVTVQLDVPSPVAITVDYSTSDGTATAGTNYVATSGTVTFDPEQLSQSFQVPLLQDGHKGDPAETVNLTLSNATNADLGANSAATLTILDKGPHAPQKDKETALSLASPAPESEYSQPVTFTASLTPAPDGDKIPTGEVDFFDGSTNLGVGAIDAGGQATFTLITLDAGSHSITAQYSGDIDYAASTSSALTQTVDADPATTTSLSSNHNPSVFGQSVTFTATVAPVPPAMGTPTGSVTFKDGGTTLATVTLTSGAASYSTSALSVASHSITAVYGGDANFTTSTSSTLSQTVNKANTSTTATITGTNPTVFGQTASFKAIVSATSPGIGTPTGTVTFKDGSTTLGTATLSAGQATYSTTNLSVASHSITAVYVGDGNFNTSTSSAVSQTVNKAATGTALVSSFNPSLFGQQVTFTATVSATSPGAGTPTGTVTFKDSTTTLGTGTLSAGTATFATVGLTTGSHSITAVYGGDGNFTTSTSSAVSQVVKAVTGIPFVAAKGQGFSGPVASFAPFASTSLTDYSATILWGDGSSSAGSLAAAGSLYQVSGSHTYAEEGPYLPSVEVDEAALGARGIGLDFALVVPLVPDTALSKSASYSLSYSGSVTLESGDTGSYNLQDAGSLSYTLTDTVQGIGTTATDTTTASLAFAAEASVSNTGSLVVGGYTTSATGSDTRSQQLQKGDLNSLASGSDTLTNLSGSGTGSTGSFAWHWNQTSSRSTTWQATATDGTSTETDTLSSTSSNTASGNYSTGAFSRRTEIDSSSTTLKPTGNDWGDAYTATSTQTASSTLTETGTLGGTVTATITGSDTSTSTETDTNPGGNASATATSSDSYTQTVIAPETPGTYSSTRTLTGSDSGGAQETVDTSTDSTSDSYTLVEVLTGNTSSGAYTRVATQTDSGTAQTTENDVSLADTATDTSHDTSTTTETGNFSSGAVTQTGTGSSTATDTESQSDGGWSDGTTGTTTASETGTLTGNYFTGMSSTATDTDTSSARDVNADSSFSDTATPTANDTITSFESFNWLTGLKTSTLIEIVNDTIGDSSSDNGEVDGSTTTDAGTLTTIESDNALTGAFSLTIWKQDSDNVTGTSSDSSLTESSTTTASDTATTIESGNLDTGAFTTTTTERRHLCTIQSISKRTPRCSLSIMENLRAARKSHRGRLYHAET